MFLLLKVLCILTLLLPCLCHDKSVPIRPPGNIKKPRILSGYNCSTNDYPYMVNILGLIHKQNRLLQACTGTLLTPYHVLTAAHCCNYPYLVVVAGEHSPNMAQRLVIAMYPHPDYIAVNSTADVGVLLLESAIEYSPYISKVRLPAKALNTDDFDKMYANKKGLIMGWGWPYAPTESERKFGADGYPVELHCSKLPVIDSLTCRKMYPAPLPISDSTVCTYEKNHGVCFGDSGGPLMSDDNIQIGVNSWTIGCGQENHPGVHMRTDQYLGFLRQFIQMAETRARNTVGFHKKLNIWLLGFAIIPLPLLFFEL